MALRLGLSRFRTADKHRQRRVDHVASARWLWTIEGYWLSPSLSAIRKPMQPSTRRAGGCFLTGAIMTGFVVGLLTGDAMRGVWLGTGLGIVAAVVVWLMDRKRD